MRGISRRLYVCGGIQGSGSTLVSWCFLQRTDMDGVLDGENDLLPFLDPRLGSPFAWYKTAVRSFRVSELAHHYEDQGWEVRPLLIVRDLRDIWASLVDEPHVANGITAEDPPLRMRLRRFVADWKYFRRMQWPILRYESLLADPEQTLQAACRKLELAWDDAMLRWPKVPADIADCRNGDATFWDTRGNSLAATLDQHRQTWVPKPIPAVDLAWLETEFREYHEHNEYAVNRADPETSEFRNKRLAPSFQATRRYRWEAQRRPLRWLLCTLGLRDCTYVKRHRLRPAA